MRDDQKTKADLLQELSILRERVTGLKQAAKQWSKTFDATSDLAFVQDKDFRFVKVNKSVCDLLKVKPEDLIGKKCYEILHKSDKPWPNCPLAKALKDKKPHTEEVDDPNIGIPLLITAFPSFDENGELTSVVHIATDITERKRMEDEIRESEERWHSLAENAPNMIIIVNRDGIIQFINRTPTGFTTEKSVGRNIYDYIRPEYRNVARETIKRVFQTGEPAGYENIAPGLHGRDSWYDTQVGAIKSNGQVVAVTLFVTDITERRKAHERLQASQERLIAFMESAADHFAVFDAHLNYLEVNTATLQFMGMRKKDVLGKNILDVFPDAKEIGLYDRFKKVIETGEPFVLDDFRPAPRFGERCFVLKAFKVGQGLGVMVSDVTEHTRARQRDDIILKICIDGFWLVDTDGKILEVNDAYCRMSGYNRDELLTMNIQDVEASETPQEIAQHIRKILGGGAHRFESCHRRKDGTIVDLDISAHYLELDGGRIFTFFRDITERKRAEKKIEELAKFPAENPNPVLRVTKDGTIIYANEASDALLRECRDSYCQVGESLPDQWCQVAAGVSSSGLVKEIEVEYECCTMSLTFAPVVDLGYVNIYGLDITERKRAEEQLAKTKERLGYILTATPVTTYTCEVGGNWAATFISENVRDQCGYEPHQFLEDYNFWVDNIHPDDRQHVLAGLSRLFEDDFHVHEYRFLHKDGSYRWVHDEMRLIRDEQGKPVECIGYWVDISERKKAEEEIEIFKKMADLATHGCAIVDLDGNLVYINDGFARMHGYEPAELIGKNLEIFHTDAQIKRVSEINKRLMETGQGIQAEEVWHVRRDGTEFPTLMSNWVLKDDNGNPLLMCGTAIDITERRKAEEQQALWFKILETLHRHESLKVMCRETVSLIKEYLGCEVVALRLREGQDYPYFVNNGFPETFIKSENYLCVHDKEGNVIKDSCGSPVLACMCGIIINAKFNPDKPFFTKEGSFWTNSTSNHLASIKAEDKGAATRTRNVCNQNGYESVALIPIKVSGDNIGLLQINDKRRNLFSLGSIQFF
ncbi:MAG: PAS domain S-box protein, partial [Planctomycetota bacterium]